MTRALRTCSVFSWAASGSPFGGVDVIATYKLHNINRVKMENLFHRIFSSAQIDISIDDRFGNPVKPREWFLVPLQVIDEAVQRVKDGSIADVVYDVKTAKFVNE